MTNSLQKLLDMTWIALREQKGSAIPVDEKSLSFFTNSPSPPKPVEVQEMKEDLPKQIPPEVDQSQAEERRLKKLLPRPVTLTEKEISKKDLDNAKKHMSISDKPLYKEPQIANKKGSWTFFIEIAEKSPHQAFIQSVLSAISSRLQIQVSPHSCKKSSLSIQLPLFIQECDHLLIVMDQHEESSIKKNLESIPGFSPSQNISPIPLSTLGTLHGRPIHGLTLHVHSHEDKTFKQQLWSALQRLAHTSYTS